MARTDANLSVDAALALAREEYAAKNPNSRLANQRAQAVMPGGNTRSVLHFDPFPLTMVKGVDAQLFDVDGHSYIDFVGEYSAGLFGHSNPVIKAAVHEALELGTVMASPTLLEANLAEVVRARFPSMELLRFCNSGTEANLMAIVTAMAVTKRRKVLVFREAYHGGVLVFTGGGSPINMPFDYVLADFNDTEGSTALIRQHAADLAAVIVEPILGAGGNIPGTPEFLTSLRAESERAGALLIFDEVKTSRCGAGGMQGTLGIKPDLTTLGKYIGGGLPTGAFGGRKDVMARYDYRTAAAFKHAGTFNNNVCTMMAGYAALTKVFTASVADEFEASCKQFHKTLNDVMTKKGVPIRCTGLGSLLTIHFSRKPINTPGDIPPVSKKLGQLFHMESILRSILVAARGDMFVSLPVTQEQLQSLRQVIMAFADDYGALIDRELPAN
ncbi:MAG: aspartate aminotransferase family protein [Pseudolabrys sp.]